MPVTNTNISTVIKKIKNAVKHLPDPSVTLVGKHWNDPFHVLISCLLSLRTKDETTLPASERLFTLADSPESMSRLTKKQIEKAIYPVGFYKTKAGRLIEICKRLEHEYAGKVPDDMDVLLTFKGVGRKTANLVITEGFRRPAMCVDTHVHRISNRFGYVKTKTPEQTEWDLRKKLPKKYWMDYNALLVTWGQNTCRPISPLCSQCPIQGICAKIGVKKSR